MKIRARFCSAALLISAASFATISCKKDESASSGGSTSGTPAAAASSASGDAKASASSFGFVARLPKSTEGFAALYRLSDLVEGFKNSNFLKKVMANPELARELNLAQLEQMTASPDFKEGMALASEIVGKEVVVALGDGFTENAVRIVKSILPLAMAGAQNKLTPDVAAQKPEWELLMEKDPAAAAAVIEGLIESDIPPFCIAVNAAGAREKLTGLLQQALEGMPPQARAMLDAGSFKLDGKYDIQTFTFTAAKAIPPEAVAGIKEKLGAMVKDPAKGASLTDKLLTKTAELSWGWVDNYLLIALGKDHSHVKFASAADNVLSLPEVAPHAAAWLAKKPVSLGYVSQKTIRALAGAFGGLTDTLVSLMEMGAAKAPFPLDGVIADVKKLGARAATLWPNDASAIVAASWWDGGWHAESFGGPKPRAFDASKPLTYGSLAGPATVFLSEGRVNEAESDKNFAFFEEVCSTLYASYQTNIKPKLPADMQGSIGMGEAVGIPMIKSLWQSVRDFRAALGSESAVLVNLDGAMPDLPQVPADFKGAKIPRVLVVSDLKDRAKLAEAWKGVGTVISGVIAMAQVPIKAEPTEMKAGDTTLWGWELPMNTGDFWPHTAVSGTRWYFGTSPSLTKEAAAKTPAPSGPASGAHVHINFNAVWDYAASFVPLAPNLPEQKKNMTDILDLCRVLGEFDARTGEEKGEMHSTVFFGIRDLK